MTRATVEEVEELAAGDEAWWPGFCGRIAEKGAQALQEERSEKGWAWGALWGWIVASEQRYLEYMRALEAYVQMKALETVGVAENATQDTVQMAKLRIETSFRLAGKVDRGRWGDKVEVGVGVAVVDAGLIGFAGALLDRVRGLPGKVEPEFVAEKSLNTTPITAISEDKEDRI